MKNREVKIFSIGRPWFHVDLNPHTWYFLIIIVKLPCDTVSRGSFRLHSWIECKITILPYKLHVHLGGYDYSFTFDFTKVFGKFSPYLVFLLLHHWFPALFCISSRKSHFHQSSWNRRPWMPPGPSSPPCSPWIQPLSSAIGCLGYPCAVSPPLGLKNNWYSAD